MRASLLAVLLLTGASARHVSTPELASVISAEVDAVADLERVDCPQVTRLSTRNKTLAE